MKPMIYVSAPYRAEDSAGVYKNIDFAGAIGRKLLELGCIPIIPHALTYAMYGADTDKPDLDQLITAYNQALIDKCTLVLVAGERLSKGMFVEVDYAHGRGIPVLNIKDAASLGFEDIRVL